RFRADPTLVGSMLDINVNNLSREGATPYLVLGVVPAEVHFSPLTTNFLRGAVTQMTVPGVDNQVDFWEPLFPRENERREDRSLDVVGKLRQGVTVEQASGDGRHFPRGRSRISRHQSKLGRARRAAAFAHSWTNQACRLVAVARDSAGAGDRVRQRVDA